MRGLQLDYEAAQRRTRLGLEYESMEAGIESERITTEVFNQLRHLGHRRQGLVSLFSDGHRFEELKAVNWANYLINTKTLELSFLEPEETRELMERTAPEFNEVIAKLALGKDIGQDQRRRRFGVCYAKRLSKRIRTVIV
jgi:hypothetical protein